MGRGGVGELWLYKTLRWPGAEWCCLEHTAQVPREPWGRFTSPTSLSLPSLQSKTTLDSFYKYGRPNGKMFSSRGNVALAKSPVSHLPLPPALQLENFCLNLTLRFTTVFEKDVSMEAWKSPGKIPSSWDVAWSRHFLLLLLRLQ